MPDEKSEPPNFKVVDRRSFGVDGARREVSPEEAKAPETRPKPASAEADRAGRDTEEDFAEGPTGFDTLVSYLSTTAMFQLGLLPGPAGEPIPVDLANARRTIDLLEILQQKTRGNLTPDEAKLLDDVIYDLRLSFVEMTKRLARMPK